MDRVSGTAPAWAEAALTLALLALVLASGIHAFSVPAADNDLWGHLHFGREILRGDLPETNLYSYTAPDHPWINHEIVAECVFAWVYDRFGAPGLLALKTACGLLTLGIMFATLRLRTREPLAWGLTLVGACSLLSWGYLVRPQLFTFLALAFLWYQLQRYAAGRLGGLWTVPLVFVVWVNSHGGVLAGLGILGAFAVLYPQSGDRPGEWKRLALVLAASAAALFINPYGIDLLFFLAADVLRDRAITEWMPVPLLDSSYPVLKLAVIAFLTAAVWRRARPFWEATIIALAVVVAFRHERHVPLFAIVAAPYLADSLGLLFQRISRHWSVARFSPATTVAAAIVVLLTAGLQFSIAAQAHRPLAFGIFVAPDLFPVEAVRFIRENHLRGNLAIPFDWGEYAIWHLYPDCRVSVDGRYTTAYPDRVLEDSWRYAQGGEGWDRILEDATLALADRRHATPRLLLADPGWRVIHEDATAMVFARTDAVLPGSLSPPSPMRLLEALRFP